MAAFRGVSAKILVVIEEALLGIVDAAEADAPAPPCENVQAAPLRHPLGVSKYWHSFPLDSPCREAVLGRADALETAALAPPCETLLSMPFLPFDASKF